MWKKIFYTAIKRNGWKQLFFYLSNLDVVRFIEFTKAREFLDGEHNIVLELGCGYSIFPALISGTCKNYICLDLSKGACKYQSSIPNVSPIMADMRYLPFKDDVMDNILAISSIEHVPEDRLVIKEIFRISKNSAEIIISVPYADRVEMKKMERSKFLLNILYKYKKLWKMILGEHLNYFIEQTSTDSFMKRYNLEEINMLIESESNNFYVENYYLYEKFFIKIFFKIVPVGWFVLKDMIIGWILWKIEDKIDLKNSGGIIFRVKHIVMDDETT